MQTACVSFNVSATGADLCVTVALDDSVIWQGKPGSDAVVIQHVLDDSVELEHELSIMLSGKLPEHTEISDQGTILQDRVVHVQHLAFDGIELGHTLCQTAVYQHDNNGHSATVTEPFYGTMGCNGKVSLRFSTPIYTWLLQNM